MLRMRSDPIKVSKLHCLFVRNSTTLSSGTKELARLRGSATSIFPTKLLRNCEVWRCGWPPFLCGAKSTTSTSLAFGCNLASSASASFLGCSSSGCYPLSAIPVANFAGRKCSPLWMGSCCCCDDVPLCLLRGCWMLQHAAAASATTPWVRSCHSCNYNMRGVCFWRCGWWWWWWCCICAQSGKSCSLHRCWSIYCVVWILSVLLLFLFVVFFLVATIDAEDPMGYPCTNHDVVVLNGV